MPTIWQPFPSRDVAIPDWELPSLYERGCLGAEKAPPEVAERCDQAIIDSGSPLDADDVCHTHGLAESGKGKLTILFPAIEQCYPGSLPGPGQDWGDCLDGDTPVWTVGGGKKASDVAVGDQVIAGDGTITNVITTDRKVSSQLVTINAYGVPPIKVTTDHPILVYRLGTYGDKNISRTLYEREKSRGRNGVVATAYESRTATWVNAGELRRGDQLLFPAAIEECERINPFGTGAGLDWCLGLWLGDGTACDHKVEFAMSNETLTSDLIQFLELAGYRPKRLRYRKNCGAWRVRVYCSELARNLQQFYDEQRSKVFPVWGVGCEELIRGLVDADGTVDGRASRFHSTSISLAHGVLAAWTQAGLAPTLGLDVRSSGSYDNAKPIYRVIARTDKQRNSVWQDGKYLCRPVSWVERHEDTQVVYDIGVDHPDHSFIAGGIIVHNCVSHGAKNAILTTMCCEIVAGKPDEVTGKIEEAPKLTPTGVTQGVLCPETIFWWRGRAGDGWFCEEATETVLKNSGAMLRKDYPDLGINLESYSLANSKRFGAQKPSGQLAEQCKQNLIRTATKISSFEALRDLTANGYGVNTCGSEGFDASRDENGVSRRKGSWAHSMATAGVDDRPVAHSKYGGPLVLVWQSWGPGWGSGGRRIMETDIEIPKGFFWVRWSDWSRRYMCAFSGHNGWPRQQLPNLGWAF